MMKREKDKNSKISTSPLQFRVNPTWLQQLDHMIGNIPSANGDQKIDRAGFVRGLVDVEKSLWRRSPYVCLHAQHFVIVTGRGEVFYHRKEALRLNHDLTYIPASLSMKSEKREDFTKRYENEQVKDIWLLNRFALWEGTEANGTPIDRKSDPFGLSKKQVNLECQRPEGSVVLRESCIALDEYVQYLQPKDTSPEDYYDRVDILIDIPTRELDLIVVVDGDLHSNTKRFGGEDFIPNLKFELRNREEVPFANTHPLQAVLQERFMRRIGSQVPPRKETDDFHAESVEQAESMFSCFHKRLETLANDPTALGPEGAGDRLRNVVFPDKYHFYRILWSWAHIGLYISIKWVKPEKPRINS